MTRIDTEKSGKICVGLCQLCSNFHPWLYALRMRGCSENRAHCPIKNALSSFVVPQACFMV
jgi:hypothetical protein